jgi:uncharacterized membrane protein
MLTQKVRSKIFIGAIAPLIFLIVVSWYNLLMVRSYNYTVFDLGLSYRLMYLFAYHKTIIFYGNDILFSPYPFGKYVFVPLSFSLYLYNNIATPLILQIIVISSGGYAVFRIAQLKTGSLFISIVIELSYFLYPSTYGFMAHGGNYQVYLEGFILIGYMFYIQNKGTYAYLAFALASITNIWGPLIVLSFIFVDFMVNHDVFNFRNIKRIIDRFRHSYIFPLRVNKRNISFLIFFLFDIIIFTQTLHFAGSIHNLISSSRLPIGNSAVSSDPFFGILNNYFSQLGTVKIPFFYHVMSPVLFTPLLTPYSILILLYFIISWQSPNTVYENLLQQYTYLFASFVFIGTIEYFKELNVQKRYLGLAKKLAILILVSSLISFSLYSPFSISNFQNGTVQQEMHVSNFDKQLTYGLSLIPSNSSVFIQNDIPQLMNRETVYMPGYYDNESVNYAVIVPFGFSPISEAYSGYSYYWASQFQNNLSYGIYEDIMGAIIYKLHYSGPPIFYVPVKEEISPGQDNLNGYGYIVNNTQIISNFTNVFHNTLWGGCYTSLSPGEYNFTFHVMTENTSKSNIYDQEIWASNGTIKLYSTKLNGFDFKVPGQWQNFTITLDLDQYYTNLECPAFFIHWNGNIEYRGITITQIRPATK